MSNLIVILGDQLNQKISSLHTADKSKDTVFMCEVRDEASYVKHHQLKIAFLFSAMRHFASELEGKGFHVIYTKLDDVNNTHNFVDEIQRVVKHLKPNRVLVTEPSEWRVWQLLESSQRLLDCPLDILPDDRFYCSHQEFANYAQEKKSLRMESFYRMMRKKHDILMENGKPVGGQWNYDSQNRKKLPKSQAVPSPSQFKPDPVTQNVITLVVSQFETHPGNANKFYFSVTRAQAKKVLARFIEERLALFGDYQDAMATNDPWLFHSHISFYLNCGLLLPKQVVDIVLTHYEQGDVPLNAVEGFVRQIIGWREFIRGVYWHKMPDYLSANHFSHDTSLPAVFWSGKTKMHCLEQSITNTLDNAYAHHIQRLMVIGNYSLLMMCSPQEVQAWYLAVYADAYEWVEMPNVVGMILHADGGYLASKPYIASGNYINKMSDYCKNCQYNVKEKTGDGACPFNYLYWDFLIRHQEKLSNNPRLAFPYKNIAKMTCEQKDAIQTNAERFRGSPQ